MINNISAKVIKDSISNNAGTNIITLELCYPKFIQAELNTHRAVVKNACSSRAIKSDRIIDDNPFIPTEVGINKPGMSANEFLQGKELEEFQIEWLELLNFMENRVSHFKTKYNAHKQTINRLLEPWMMSKGVFTATLDSWKHVLLLRDSKYAQPEFRELAKKIREAINSSIPQVLEQGEWHLPYVDSKEAGEDNVNIKISASCIAQVSYRKLDTSIEKALDIFDKLNLLSKDKNNPPHISPVQHICLNYSIDNFKNMLNPRNYYAEFGLDFIQCSKFIETNNLLVRPDFKVCK